MRLTTAIHILAGTLGLLSGYVALGAAKGQALHRRSGMLFVCAMLTMSVLGMTLALWRDRAPAVNVPAALLTFYLVITSLATVRPVPGWSRSLDIGAMLVALGVGLTMLAIGYQAIAGRGGFNSGYAVPSFMFAVVGLLGAAGDFRVLRSGTRTGGPRLARHLWRMCFALFIAALSASVQFGKLIPRQFRLPGMLSLPVLAVIVMMFYWLWRVRVRRNSRGIVVVGVPETA